MTIAAVPNDPTGELVGAWLAAVLPRMDDIVQTTEISHDGVVVCDCVITAARLDEAAWRCAVEIAAERLRYWPTKFFNWFAALADAAGVDATEQARAASLLCKDLGTPAHKGPDSHLCGLVGETLFGRLLQDQDRGSGLPIAFEGHDWSVTDPGGDCLAIYSTGDGLAFDLWECKAIYGTTATGTVIKSAAEQLHENAAEYLARFAVVAERADLPAGIAAFVLNLQDLWLDDDAAKGAGVAVATHRVKCTNNSFSQVPVVLHMPTGRVQGNYASAPDFLAFATRVRDLVWKGCGLP